MAYSGSFPDDPFRELPNFKIRVERKEGMLIIISGPSGVGKGTILKEVMREDQNLIFSVSVTTRRPRPGERDGIDYFFITEEEFFRLRDEGKLLEWAEVHGHYYGTPKDFVLSKVREGYDVVLDIDVQGAEKVMNSWRDPLTIFILPPSMDELKRRLLKRGTDSPEEIRKRLMDAYEELKLSLIHI